MLSVANVCTGRGFSRRSIRSGGVLAAAVLGALSNSTSALAQRYWDINDTGSGSGVVNTTADWLNGTIASSAFWNGTDNRWYTDSTGGGGGPNTDVGSANTGVFSAGSDATGTYFVELPTSANLTAGGFSVLSTSGQGNVIIPGDGNGLGTSASKVNVGSGTFTINVDSGASLSFGYRLKLSTFAGSATITKTGAGLFNLVTEERASALGSAVFTGKYDVQAGTMGVFFGGNTMLGNPASFVSDQLKVSGNAVIKTFQQSSSVTVNGNEGITIGSGGATFFFAGAKDLDPTFGYTTLGSIQFTSRITGGADGARVPITIMSNTLSGNNGIGQSTGTTAFNFVDNSSSTTAPPLYAKWIVKSGELGPARGSTTADTALGAVPTAYLADAITLDGGYLRPNGNCTIPANRGITLGGTGGPGWGGLHPINGITFTVDSKITGSGGQLRVFLENSSTGKVVLTGTNDYTGGTWVTAVGTNSPLGALQGTTSGLQGNIQNDGRLIFDQTITGSYGGIISGTGTITKSNTGTVFFTGTNTYSTTTTVSGGTLVGNSTASFPGYNSPGKYVVSGATSTIAGSAGGTGQWSISELDDLRNNATFSSNFGINVDTGNTFNYTSDITQSVGFMKLGAGELQLSGTSTYNGATTVLGGILSVTNTGNLGATNNSITLNGGTLKLLGGFNPDNGGTRGISMGASGGTIDTNGFTPADMQVPIGGPGSFTKAGGGTIVSGQNNAFSALFLKGGTFEVVNDANLNPSGAPITFDGGTLKVRTSFSLAAAHGTLTVNSGGGTFDTGSNDVDASGNAVEGAGAFTKSGTGALTVKRVRTGGLSVSDGTVKSAGASGAAAATSRVNTFSVGASGNYDINDNKAIVDYTGTGPGDNSPSATIRTYLINGRGGVGLGNASWAGTGGITSSAAVADTDGLAVGYREAQPPDFDIDPVASFGGQTVDDTAVLMRYTYSGDANLDGVVDRSDLLILQNSFNQTSGVDWLHGDFDYNGTCDRDDLQLLSNNYGNPPIPSSGSLTASFGSDFSASFAGAAAVPEPGSLGLLGLGAIGLLGRRRRLR